jgi:maltose-binding protein MalE
MGAHRQRRGARSLRPPRAHTGTARSPRRSHQRIVGILKAAAIVIGLLTVLIGLATAIVAERTTARNEQISRMQLEAARSDERVARIDEAVAELQKRLVLEMQARHRTVHAALQVHLRQDSGRGR